MSPVPRGTGGEWHVNWRHRPWVTILIVTLSRHDRNRDPRGDQSSHAQSYSIPPEGCYPTFSGRREQRIALPSRSEPGVRFARRRTEHVGEVSRPEPAGVLNPSQGTE